MKKAVSEIKRRIRLQINSISIKDLHLSFTFYILHFQFYILNVKLKCKT